MHTDTRPPVLLNRVRERRKELGWTQQALADRAGVSRQTVNKVETKQSDAVPKMTCMQLAQALGVDEGWLFYPGAPTAECRATSSDADGEP